MKRILPLILLILSWTLPCHAQFKGGWSPSALSEIVQSQSFTISETTSGAERAGGGIEVFEVPANSMVKFLIVDYDEPSADSGTAVAYLSIGSAANSDTDLSDTTDIDFLLASPQIAGLGIFGENQASYDSTKFATTKKSEGYYSTTDTTLYLNYFVESSEAATVTLTGKVYIVYDHMGN